MMEKFILHKNKPEVINCQFNIQGATPEQTIVRLCLEFDDNRNLFFYGKIDEEGSCEVSIPVLKEIPHTEGKLVIEAIVDSTYFKVFETEVELSSPIEVKLESAITQNTDKKIKLNKIKINESKKQTELPAKSQNPFVITKNLKNTKKLLFPNLKIILVAKNK